MREVITNTFVSLDGVMQAPGGPEEDPSAGFKLGGWSVNYWDHSMGQVMDEGLKSGYDLLLGRKTYEIFAAHWPFVEGEPLADHFNKAIKYVASNTLKDPTWSNTEVLSGDVVDKVKELKGGNGPELQVHGSAGFIQTLLKADLIDELRIWIFPVVLGNGKRLFGEGSVPGGMELTDMKKSSTGVLMTTYRRAGEVPIGSFALEEPSEAEKERRERQRGE